MLALGVAPAIVRAESLMRIVVPSTEEVLHYGAIKISGADPLMLEDELTALTRRVWLPRIVVQIYEESPLISELLRTQ